MYPRATGAGPRTTALRFSKPTPTFSDFAFFLFFFPLFFLFHLKFGAIHIKAKVEVCVLEGGAAPTSESIIVGRYLGHVNMRRKREQQRNE